MINFNKTHDFTLINCDTDSISFCKADNSIMTLEEQQNLINEINSYMPEYVKYAHDGFFDAVLVLKAKNYVLKKDGKLSIKGSALKSSKTEKAIKEFMMKMIECLLDDDKSKITTLYHEYIKECFNMQDIGRWCSKKTITEKVLNSERTNEKNIMEALEGVEDIQMGNKIYVFFDTEGKLKLQQNWTGQHDPYKLMERLYKTLLIFQNLIDINSYPKYYLKTKRKDLIPLMPEFTEQLTVTKVKKEKL